MAETDGRKTGQGVVFTGPAWLRRYPPLILLVIALLITVLILPSALTLPQANPSTVLEYAPVPPEEESPPSSEGALSSLGLATSAGLGAGEGPGAGAAAPTVPRGGKGKKPVTKRCVGRPARQTEDPNAPPCVPFYEGDNGGQTWQGVDAQEIVVIVYRSASISVGGDAGSEATPPNRTFCDVDSAEGSSANCGSYDPAGGARRPGRDHTEVRIARALSLYFNFRFQTYNRHVHYYIYWTPSFATPSSRRADAQDIFDRMKPFAVIDRAFFGGFNAIFAEAIVKRRMMAFGAYTAIPNSYYRQYAPMIWNFWPDVEHQVDLYDSYVCQKIATQNVSYSGAGIPRGQPRKYGFLSTTDEFYPGLKYFADLSYEGLKKCLPPESIGPRRTYSRNQYQIDTHPDAPQEAAENIATFIGNKVTTILWLSGYETHHSFAAKNAEYYPEWVVAGDALNDGINNSRGQQQDVWRHAWVVSNFLREDRLADAPCRQAYRESVPSGNSSDEGEFCIMYRGHFMLFRSLQSAGPYLAPEAVDQGNHAIPRQASVSPYTAACFFDPGDYTCVKDANVQWWDPDAPDPGGSASARGCYRMVEGGKRFLAGTWGSIAEPFVNRADPCNNVNSDEFANPYGPAG